MAALVSVSAIFAWCFRRRNRQSLNHLDEKAAEEKMIDTRPSTYSRKQVSELPSKPSNYRAGESELPSKHSRFPEEIDGRPKMAPTELSSEGR